MRFCCALFVVALLAGCATTNSSSRVPDLATADVVDLTYAFDEHTLYWPNSPISFELKQQAYGMTPGGYFYASNTFCAPEHGGTHLDAPIHFFAQGRTIDQIPPRQLIGPAVVIDVTKQSAADHDYRLTVDDVKAWEASHGTIPNGAIAILRTGWGQYYGNRKAYFGDDKPGATDNLHFPSFSAEAARLLVEQRHVGAIGLDTPSIDYGPSKDFIVHQIAMTAQVPGFENLANLERLPETGAWIIALPMKIGAGSGGPLRAVALLPR